ncbi:unnamed protein product, partial [Mesorhabditis spiculigera]
MIYYLFALSAVLNPIQCLRQVRIGAPRTAREYYVSSGSTDRIEPAEWPAPTSREAFPPPYSPKPQLELVESISQPVPDNTFLSEEYFRTEKIPVVSESTTTIPYLKKKARIKKRVIQPYQTQIQQYYVPAVAPQENYIEMPAIVDKESNVEYSKANLVAMCAETRKMGSSWGISDIADFASRNCVLIRMYYPNHHYSQPQPAQPVIEHAPILPPKPSAPVIEQQQQQVQPEVQPQFQHETPEQRFPSHQSSVEPQPLPHQSSAEPVFPPSHQSSVEPPQQYQHRYTDPYYQQQQQPPQHEFSDYYQHESQQQQTSKPEPETASHWDQPPLEDVKPDTALDFGFEQQVPEAEPVHSNNYLQMEEPVLPPPIEEKPEVPEVENKWPEIEEVEPKPEVLDEQMMQRVLQQEIDSTHEDADELFPRRSSVQDTTPTTRRNSGPGRPIAESTPNDVDQGLDITVPSPTDTPVKKELNTQLSDTQNSDRTSDGFVKVQNFTPETEAEYSAANPLFSWNAGGKPVSRTLNTSGRYSVDDYREQEANDSGASSILTRAQISNQYMEYKKRIPQIVSRQSILRGPNGQVIGRPNPLFEEGRRSVTSRTNNHSRPASAHYDVIPQKSGDGNSFLTNPDGPLEYSMDSPHSAYGDNFVENSRRSRLHRASQGYRPQIRQDRYPRQPHAYQSNGGRRSVAGYGDMGMTEQHVRRPQSSYDPRALARMERSGLGIEHYDAFNSPGMSSESADGADSDAEMAQYNVPVQQAQRHFSKAEIYYIGSLRVPLGKFITTVRQFPPPPQYDALNAMEKVAFVFYTALWQRQYFDVEDFRKKFNRDYYALTASGVPNDEALYRICAEMQTRYSQLNKDRYTSAQKQLFSDERDSHDEEERTFLPNRHCLDDDDQSERGSGYGESGDAESVDLQTRGPTKYSDRCSFSMMGPHGQVLVIDPKRLGAEIMFTNIQRSISCGQDEKAKRLQHIVQMFRGPLTTSTPSHIVTLYIQRQLQQLEMTEVAQENAFDNDVIDCRLLWKLLETLVQQHGRVTGPDIARLLLKAAPARSRETSSTPTYQPVDGSQRKLFDEFILQGHIDEAIDTALRNEMYTEALLLARRVAPQRIEEVEMLYMTSRLHNHPITTLLTVAANHKAPVLVNPATDDGGSWRAHAAIVLANLQTECAMSTVYELGKFLAQKEYDAAADFCFLAVAILKQSNVFVPPNANGSASREHISLVNASLPHDKYNSTECSYGFSLTNLHATEIFAYGISLAGGESHLIHSIEFQKTRVKYAKLLASMGFPKQAYNYATNIAQQIWHIRNYFPIDVLVDLCDVAYQCLMSNEDPTNAAVWINELQDMIEQNAIQPQGPVPPQNIPPPTVQKQETQPPMTYVPPPVPAAAQTPPQPPAHQPHQPPAPQQAAYQPPAPPAASPPRSRVNSITSEANDWHSQQDPISMHTTDRRASISSQASASRAPAHHYAPPQPSHQQQHHQQQHQQSASPQNSAPPSPLATVPEIPEYKWAPPAQQPPPQPVMQHPQQQQHQQNQQHQQQHQQQQHQQYLQDFQQQPSIPHSTPAPQRQQQQHQQQPQPQGSKENSPARQNPGMGGKSGSGGWFGAIKSSVATQLHKIGSKNEVHLPDDSKKTIYYDDKLGRWVGEGVEEEEAPPPPPAMGMPTMPTMAPLAPAGAATPTAGPQSPQGPSSGLRAARAGGASRYFNGVTSASSAAQGAPMAAPTAPVMMPIPTSFNFIPQMPDSEESVDPFSAAPAEPEQAAVQAN